MGRLFPGEREEDVTLPAFGAVPSPDFFCSSKEVLLFDHRPIGDGSRRRLSHLGLY